MNGAKMAEDKVCIWSGHDFQIYIHTKTKAIEINNGGSVRVASVDLWVPKYSLRTNPYYYTPDPNINTGVCGGAGIPGPRLMTQEQENKRKIDMISRDVDTIAIALDSISNLALTAKEFGKFIKLARARYENANKAERVRAEYADLRNKMEILEQDYPELKKKN